MTTDPTPPAPFTVGQVVYHRASGTAAVVLAVFARCENPAHRMALECQRDHVNCQRVPTGEYKVSVGFGPDQVHEAPGHMLTDRCPTPTAPKEIPTPAATPDPVAQFAEAAGLELEPLRKYLGYFSADPGRQAAILEAATDWSRAQPAGPPLPLAKALNEVGLGLIAGDADAVGGESLTELLRLRQLTPPSP